MSGEVFDSVSLHARFGVAKDMEVQRGGGMGARGYGGMRESGCTDAYRGEGGGVVYVSTGYRGAYGMDGVPSQVDPLPPLKGALDPPSRGVDCAHVTKGQNGELAARVRQSELIWRRHATTQQAHSIVHSNSASLFAQLCHATHTGEPGNPALGSIQAPAVASSETHIIVSMYGPVEPSTQKCWASTGS